MFQHGAAMCNRCTGQWQGPNQCSLQCGIRQRRNANHHGASMPQAMPRKVSRILALFALFQFMETNHGNGPKWCQEDVFLLIQALPTFWAERIWILRIFTFEIFGSQISGLGPLGPSLGPPTWARRGPTHLGPAWAHPRGPSLGPPTWARLGPTHLGPAWAHPLGFPDAAGAGRILKSRSRPLPTHPGMKYFRKETLAVDRCQECT